MQKIFLERLMLETLLFSVVENNVLSFNNFVGDTQHIFFIIFGFTKCLFVTISRVENLELNTRQLSFQDFVIFHYVGICHPSSFNQMFVFRMETQKIFKCLVSVVNTSCDTSSLANYCN
ncbi:CLUMA_CG008517, isoform A [Clunio marinus]|uniref:CLUMA_CG008517, isoform A n=1 Tax=Clunio marinus TaxID=568069 RepID=A0A1J1I3W3_9DIPT|nr:CLUMA_CG008517, isoform A [Clunio marinus]